ncbi:programmed cell death protein 2 [Periophthalmus magnuspinnatus]|uniref:programmed cell death protein 2 n=1 Tax=Periophthalmus magnuspinnatus TaxID=409849 RepID=UPI00145B8034|nr:programmed cell death protein 2 [Periophthalmus magnuspinnatus]
MSTEEVILGFLEEAEPWQLLSPQFPSKVGGKPAWLGQKGVPCLSQLECEICHLPMVFLLQVYAPLSGQDQCFHRTLFLFCCKTPECYSHNDSRCMKVFRSQMPRKNEFYSYEPPPEDEPPSEPYKGHNVLPISGVKLCWICGCPGTKACSRCHSVTYCGKHHQTIHWKHSHKRECGSQESSSVSTSPFLFPEFELVTEPENLEKNAKDTETKHKETEDIQSNVEETLADSLAETELEEMAMHETEEIKVFQRFKKRIASEPHQVVRYTHGGLPLWVSAKHIPSDDDIPPCSCGSKRVFEFQVMPQLLNNLCVDSTGASIDWGTVAVFTCSLSCSREADYITEFVWKQDFTADENNKGS